MPRRRRAAMLATTVLTALATTQVATHMAAAQDAGWVGGNSGDPGEWLEPNNWNPQTVPAGTATFGASSVTSVSSGGLVNIGAITFTNTAPAYTITTNDIFIVGGAGVTNNNTSVTQTFN